MYAADALVDIEPFFPTPFTSVLRTEATDTPPLPILSVSSFQLIGQEPGAMEAAGWQQHWRTPAFGEWNYGQYDYSADGYTPLTPCFDVVAVRMTNAIPVRKPTKRARATGNTMRRQRIPAFGEWNYSSDGKGSWPAASTPFFDLAAAHKPANTERKNDGDYGFAETKRRAAEAHGRRLSKVADSGDYYAARKSCFTVVAKAVDDDLYGVPPDMLFQKQARRGGWLRMLLMAGCFCRGGTCTT